MATAASTPPSQDSNYYQITGRIPFASRISNRVRRRMYDCFLQQLKPQAQSTILDLGVTCDTHSEASNYLERLYPYKDRIVCAGIEDARHLELQYPGVRFVQVEANRPLPFRDGEFDFVFCNAVIEHAGSRESQCFLIREILRVGASCFVTTPNRWFPVELHTTLPFLHYLPAQSFRAILRSLGQEFYAREENLNLLDTRSLTGLFPADCRLSIHKVKLLGLTSNLVAIASIPQLS